MQFQSTLDIFQDTESLEMQQESLQKNLKILSCSLQDFLAKVLALLGNNKDLKTAGEICFLNLQGFLPTNNPNIFYSKMLQVYYILKVEELSNEFLQFSMNWGMMYCGRCIIRATMESPNIEEEFSLKDILESNVDTKYLMSKEKLKEVNREGVNTEQVEEDKEGECLMIL